jgi:hypothetical protein
LPQAIERTVEPPLALRSGSSVSLRAADGADAKGTAVAVGGVAVGAGLLADDVVVGGASARSERAHAPANTITRIDTADRTRPRYSG